MAVQVDVSRDIFQRGAYQDHPSQPEPGRSARILKPARRPQPFQPHPQILELRRRRRARRLREAGSALAWTAGCGALIAFVMGGLLAR